jgi:hypothetical protein
MGDPESFGVLENVRKDYKKKIIRFLPLCGCWEKDSLKDFR